MAPLNLPAVSVLARMISADIAGDKKAVVDLLDRMFPPEGPDTLDELIAEHARAVASLRMMSSLAARTISAQCEMAGEDPKALGKALVRKVAEREAEASYL